MAKDWLVIDRKIIKFEDSVDIPDAFLTDAPFLIIKTEKDLKKIPIGGGCYWIWTNEKIVHSFHNSLQPKTINSGQIIYNGIAKDDVRGRINKHLLAK